MFCLGMPKVSLSVPVPWSVLEDHVRVTLHDMVLRSGAFERNKFREFSYGDLNNEKSLNTSLVANGAPDVHREGSRFNFISKNSSYFLDQQTVSCIACPARSKGTTRCFAFPFSHPRPSLSPMDKLCQPR